MGTSQSKPSARTGSPLVPSWAEQDPAPGATPPPPADDEVLESRHNAGMRSALRDYLRTGDEGSARKALGHYSRRSTGSGSSAGARVGRAARAGGLAFAALASARANNPPPEGAVDLRTFAGRPTTEAINAIVDAFCPPGILDEDAIRAAMSEALAEALAGLDQFDPTQLSDFAIVVAMRSYVAELVFNAVMVEQGQSAVDATPLQAVERENNIRDIVRELTDLKATAVLQAEGQEFTPQRIESMVREIATLVYEEMATW